MRKNMKFLALLLVIVFLFSSCGNRENNSSVNNSSGNFSFEDEDVSHDLLVSTAFSETTESEVSKNESVVESEETESLDNSEYSEVSEISKDDSSENGDFFILYTEDKVDFSEAPKAEIEYYPWNDDYTPYAYGQVVFKKDDGFYVFMYCEESNPKTEIKQIGGNVYLDSALEFFCDFRPEKKKWNEINYINLEMNSAGVYLANYGHYSVLRLSKERMRVKGEVFDNYWTVTAYIPLKLIKNIYGDFEIGEGSVVECNFSKCGSGTEIKHWGTWQELGGENPNFHQPRYFAEVEIRR